jgi:hypothetical protein
MKFGDLAFRVTSDSPLIAEFDRASVFDVTLCRPQDIAIINVNFNFGEETSEDDRQANAEEFVKSLNEALGMLFRFGVRFEVGEVPAKGTNNAIKKGLKSGAFTKRDAKDSGLPGSYEYSDDIIKLTQDLGRTDTEPVIKVVVVKDLSVSAVTVSPAIETITPRTKLQAKDKEGRTANKEAIFFRERVFVGLGNETIGSYRRLTPPHEVVHLAGLPDNPNDLYVPYSDEHLNSYNPNRKPTLSRPDESAVQLYFDKKTNRRIGDFPLPRFRPIG